jgi:hypothetical protein
LEKYEMETQPIQFIDEEITPIFATPPLFEKIPECPVGFLWRGQTYRIAAMLTQWRDNRRRGKMERNMAPGHASHASVVGSWGVGKFYFRVQDEDDNIFEIYYDRAPSNAGDRKGKWFLLGQREKK